MPIRVDVVKRGWARVLERPDGRKLWTKLYGVWNAMRGRCNSPGTKDYKRYGARGIRVCDEWSDYGVFRSWALANGFRKGLTLDRVNSNGNYEPDNCRWISKGEQQANIRCAIMLTHKGETRSLYRWARIVGVSADFLRVRHYNGWTDEQVLTTPRLSNGHVRPNVQHKPRGRAAAKAKRLAAMSFGGLVTNCADCNEPYGSPRFPDLIIEDWAWKRISPTGDGGGLLCPNCICARLHIEGVFCRSVFTSGYLALVDETPTWLLKERLLRLEERFEEGSRRNDGL